MAVAGQDDKAGGITGFILEVLTQHFKAVQLSGQARCDSSVALIAAGCQFSCRASGIQASDLLNTQLADMAVTLGQRLRVGGNGFDILKLRARQGQQAVVNRLEMLADDIKGVQKNAGEMEMKVGEISTILETINTLSDQTNLLALNAAIEAARAGEHGRGFAVVADEVRKLAQSSRESSDKISTLLSSLREASVVVVNDINKNVESISNSMETTTEGRKTAEQVKEAAGNVEDMANNMSSAAEQQSVTTEEIAKELVTVEEAARHEVDIAQNLSNLSGEMQANNQLLQHTIDGFKAD